MQAPKRTRGKRGSSKRNKTAPAGEKEEDKASGDESESDDEWGWDEVRYLHRLALNVHAILN